MTTLLYRGQSYEQGSLATSKLRYDRSVYGDRQKDARSHPVLTYRGCTYTAGQSDKSVSGGNFLYRGVSYSR